MLTRNLEGKLSLSRLEISIFFDDLFEVCNNRKEVEILASALVDTIRLACYDQLDYLGDEDPYDIELN